MTDLYNELKDITRQHLDGDKYKFLDDEQAIILYNINASEFALLEALGFQSLKTDENADGLKLNVVHLNAKLISSFLNTFTQYGIGSIIGEAPNTLILFNPQALDLYATVDDVVKDVLLIPDDDDLPESIVSIDMENESILFQFDIESYAKIAYENSIKPDVTMPVVMPDSGFVNQPSVPTQQIARRVMQGKPGLWGYSKLYETLTGYFPTQEEYEKEINHVLDLFSIDTDPMIRQFMGNWYLVGVDEVDDVSQVIIYLPRLIAVYYPYVIDVDLQECDSQQLDKEEVANLIIDNSIGYQENASNKLDWQRDGDILFLENISQEDVVNFRRLLLNISKYTDDSLLNIFGICKTVPLEDKNKFMINLQALCLDVARFAAINEDITNFVGTINLPGISLSNDEHLAYVVVDVDEGANPEDFKNAFLDYLRAKRHKMTAGQQAVINAEAIFDACYHFQQAEQLAPEYVVTVQLNALLTYVADQLDPLPAAPIPIKPVARNLLPELEAADPTDVSDPDIFFVPGMAGSIFSHSDEDSDAELRESNLDNDFR